MRTYKHICKNCKSEYEDCFPNSKFCCRECYRLSLKNNAKCKDVKCPVCGKLFHQSRTTTKYCSVECRRKDTQNRVDCQCEYCGKIFKRIKSEYDKRERHFCSVSCRKNGLGWNDEDTDILRRNFGKISYTEMVNLFSGRKTVDMIKRRAIYIGLTAPRNWSKAELEILVNNYSKIPMEEVMKLLPNRTATSILGQARRQNLLSYFYLTSNYTNAEEEYIRNNYQTKSNEELGRTLNRSPSGIAQHLLAMDLHRPKEIDKYINLNRYIRARLTPWRDSFRKSQNYICSVTGSKSDIIVHHIRSFNLIFCEAVENIQFPIYESMSDYSEMQLNELFNEYMNVQNFYGQYICISETVHRCFHARYGYGNNTQEQWDEFLKQYK